MGSDVVSKQVSLVRTGYPVSPRRFASPIGILKLAWLLSGSIARHDGEIRAFVPAMTMIPVL
jgi:hypothetical protein